MIDLTNVSEIKNVLSNKVIDKIEDTLGNVIYEAYKKLTDIPPFTITSKGQPLKNYKIYGNSRQSNLPDGYTEVEWLKSTKDINLGIKTNDNMQIEAKYLRTNTSAQFVYHSDSDSSLSTNTTAYASANGNWRFGNTSYAVSQSLNVIYESIQNKDGVWINGEKRGNYTNVPTFISSSNLSALGSLSNPSVQLYYLKVKNYNSSTYDYIWIPCKRDLDNVYGLYDIINNQFYTNSQATFTTGNEILPTQANPIPIRSVGDTLLPSEYQEVEYIESTGRQYINTGFKPNNLTSFEVDGQLINIFSLYGIQNVFNMSSASSTLYFKYNNQKYDSSIPYGERHIYKHNKNVLYVDGNLEYTFSDDNFSSNYSIYLFARNNNNSPSDGGRVRIYYVKIWDDDILAHNFIPCYRTLDNVIGLYDTVNGVFYTNAGTGTFLKGTDKTTYRIPVTVSDGTNSTTTNIYLDEPLRKVGNYADYIDYEEQKVYRNVIVNDDSGEDTIANSYSGTTDTTGTSITLPSIPTITGTTIISVDTEVQPSSMYIKYK